MKFIYIIKLSGMDVDILTNGKVSFHFLKIFHTRLNIVIFQMC
jgi:hypothetical protein